MDFIVGWLHESGHTFYLTEIVIRSDGCALKWSKEKGMRFHALEKDFIAKCLELYFDEECFFEYVGGNE